MSILANYSNLVEKLDKLIFKGDYKDALTLVRTELKKNPGDFYLCYQYAKLLGDWADELPRARQVKYKAEAVSILKPLMKRLRGKPTAIRFRLSLNYYYQSADWSGMYAFGERFQRLNRQYSLYAKGLGATLFAFDLSLAGSKTARVWIRRALHAWQAYDFSNEAYYFPHYCFAKALALDGQLPAALKRLKVAARLSKRSVSDWEFSDVVKLCS